MFSIFQRKPESEFGKNIGVDRVLCRFKWDYPIVNLMSGHIRNCCRTPKQVITQKDLDLYGQDAILNLPFELERRLEKMQGITHADCASCLRLEASGVPAPRSGVKGWLVDYWLKQGLGKEDGKSSEELIAELSKNIDINSPLLKSNHPEMLEIVLGNTCNLKCTYCSPHYSSLWAQELIKHGEITQEEYKKIFPEAPPGLSKVFWEWFYDVARHSVETINILGGEPTYIPGFYDVLQKLVDAYQDLGKKNHHRVELGVISNMNSSTVAIDKLVSFMPELAKYFLFRLQPSIEAMHGRAEYIRYGLKWSTLENNVRRMVKEAKKLNLSQDQFSMGFQMAINAFSISSLPEFVMWVNEMNEELDFEFGLMKNIVSFPRHHNPMILTPDFAHYVQEASNYVRKYEEKNDRIARTQRYYGSWFSFREHLLDGLYESLQSETRTDYDIESRISFFEFVQRNDERRGCNIIKTFPELENFFNLCHGMHKERYGIR
jgi:hypothetical protein